MSSSSDERLSVQPTGFDTGGGGVAALYRDPLASPRAKEAPVKQEPEGFSSLSSFDLPADALQDRVSSTGDEAQLLLSSFEAVVLCSMALSRLKAFVCSAYRGDFGL